MSLRLILMHVIYRVIFGVGIATLMWAGGQFVYSRTYPWYAVSTIKHHPENMTGGSDMSDIQLLPRAQSGTLQAVPLHRSNAAVPIGSHRNTFGNELQNIRVGDEIQVVTPEGILGYFVTTIEIADPSNSSGLQGPGPSQLTIATSYPSPGGSAAPQRFIIRARHRER
jgi:LPXTG-site transpeptidase (sortase) family protein